MKRRFLKEYPEDPTPAPHGRIQWRHGAWLAAIALIWQSSPLALATLADYQTAVTNTASLLSYYTFDQSNAQDSVGANHGTPNPSVAYAAGVGGEGKGFFCNGGAQIDFGPVSDFEFPSGSGTIEGWIRADWAPNTVAYEPTTWANGDGFNSEYSVHLAASKAAVGIWNGAHPYSLVTTPFASTNWHHLATVFDNGEFKVYWDGQFAGSTFKVLGANPTEFVLAASGRYSGEGWVGMLDEVAVYSTALDAGTVQGHYDAFFAGTPPVIARQPTGGVFLPGVAVTLKVTATGPNLTYKWYKGATELPGETGPTLTLANLSAANAGAYHVVVSNPGADVPSAEVSVSLGSLSADLSRYQTAVSNEASLISFYTFDQLTADDVFDSNHGTLQGSADFAPGVGSGAGQAVELDGGGQVNLPASADFAFPSGQGSVEAWVRADWPATFTSYNPTLFANRDRNGGLIQWSVNMTPDKQTLGIYNGSRSVLFAIPGGGAGTNWHHLAVVFDQGNNTLYWDGEVMWPGTLTQIFGDTPGTTQLGSSSPGATTEGWIGRLDDVAFYSSALTAGQVRAHFNAYYQDQPPVISAQPRGGVFLAGTPFSIGAQAQGANLVYQWFKDGAPVSGATGQTLSFANPTPADSGVYYLAASNSAGVAQSQNAVVNVGNNIERYQAAVRAEPSLISYYTFDASDAADSQGAHPGTPVNSPGYADGPGGVTNQSLLLNGSSWINLGQVAAFDFYDGGTAEVWLQPGWTSGAALPDAPCIFADRNGGSVWSIHMPTWQNSIGNWNNSQFNTLPVSNAKGWHHFAITFGGGLVSMYWDGQPLGSFNQSIHFVSAKTTQIGSPDPVSPQQPWIGNLDEVAFYSAPLSAEAIQSHFLAMVGPAPAAVLAYSVSGNQITLSWPGDVTGYTLMSSPSLSEPDWTPVPGVANHSVTITVTPGNRFFRLSK